MSSSPAQAAKIIQSYSGDFKPLLGIVLGSGLGNLTKQLKLVASIPFEKLPGFPHLTVKGHTGELLLGYLNQTPVACLKGRSHTYETLSYDEVKTYVRTLKLIGCESFLATNASGSLCEDMGPGELMLVNDHINFQPGNPLAGKNEDEFGPRFLPLDKAYCPELQTLLQNIAKQQNIKLHNGVYISVLGPSYETAAEIRAFKILGADAVGMSTVPEVIIANHCGLKVAVIATITNYATGLTTTSHSHDDVVKTANKTAIKLESLVITFAEKIHEAQ